MLDQIIAASKRLEGVCHRTPVMTSSQLDEISGAEVFIKCENLQRGGAFKFRGAYNAISQLDDESKKRGIITHSSGNHAQAVAITGRMLEIPTTIVMPKNAPQVKINATKGYGAEVVLCEPTQEARESTVDKLIKKHGYTLIHPFDNDQIIAGAATTSVELIEQAGPLDIIIAPVGGGGLISGIAMYSKLSRSVNTVYAAEPVGANDAYRSFNSSEHIQSQIPHTIADGLRTTTSERTIGYIREYVDDIVTVTDNQIIGAVSFLMERMKLVVEPSGAAGVAAVLNSNIYTNKRIGVVITGGNMDVSNFIRTLLPLD